MELIKVRCHGKAHRVRLKGGALGFLDHSIRELEAEIAMAHLASERPRGCAALLWAVRHLELMDFDERRELERREGSHARMVVDAALRVQSRRWDEYIDSEKERLFHDERQQLAVGVGLMRRVLRGFYGEGMRCSPEDLDDGLFIEVSGGLGRMVLYLEHFRRAWVEARCRVEVDGEEALLLELAPGHADGSWVGLVFGRTSVSFGPLERVGPKLWRLKKERWFVPFVPSMKGDGG